jgi:hypothetical protein
MLYPEVFILNVSAFLRAPSSRLKVKSRLTLKKKLKPFFFLKEGRGLGKNV